MLNTPFHRRWKARPAGWIILVFALLLVVSSVHADSSPLTVLVSANPDAAQANAPSTYPNTSYNGQRVIFSSQATDLRNVAAPDSDSAWDVFVRDMVTGKNHLVSGDKNQQPGSGQSDFGVLSRDGRYAVYQTTSRTILTIAQPNDFVDIYLVDLPSNLDNFFNVTLISRNDAASPAAGNADSGITRNPDTSLYSQPHFPAAIYTAASGTVGYPQVIFESKASNLDNNFPDANGKTDLFVRLNPSGGGTSRTRLLTRLPGGGQFNGSSTSPAVSFNGRYVAFVSDASNILPGVSGQQIYLMDRDADANGSLDDTDPTYTLASRTVAGLGGNGMSWYPSISADGAVIAFDTLANNLATHQYIQSGGIFEIPDSNASVDVYIFDRRSESTELQSVITFKGDPEVIPSTVFGSPGQPIYETYGDSFAPSVSVDGRVVSYKTKQNGIVENNTRTIRECDPVNPTICFDKPVANVFRHIRQPEVPYSMGETQIVSMNNDGTELPTGTDWTVTKWPNQDSSFPYISGNQRYIFYSSDANNLPNTTSDSTPGLYARDYGDKPTAPLLYESQSEWAFAPAVDDQAQPITHTFTLTNIGDAQLLLQPLTVEGASDFSINTGTCTNSEKVLNAMNGVVTDSCTFEITFTQTVNQPETAHVLAVWGDAVSQTHTLRIRLSGGPRTTFLPFIRR